MKASFFCTNTYLSAEPFRYPGWPTPPGLYRPEIGLKSADVALEQAKLADELGFDWVSCSEHHYTPLLQTPNAMVFAGALSQVVKRAKIAVLGPLVSMNNPVRIAEELAMLDQLSHGRLIVRPLIGTSLKMNLTSSQAADYFKALRPLVAPLTSCELFVLPPFTSIWVARERLAGSNVSWGAQDVHAEERRRHSGPGIHGEAEVDARRDRGELILPDRVVDRLELHRMVEPHEDAAQTNASRDDASVEILPEPPCPSPASTPCSTRPSRRRCGRSAT